MDLQAVYQYIKCCLLYTSGTGLGLNIVKTILDMHQGATYGVKSQVGHGSTFWFELNIYHNE